MNPNTGEIVYGDAEVIDHHGKKQGVRMVPLPEEHLSALQNMSLEQRMAWAHARRPSLEQLVEVDAELNSTQSKALSKQERKRQLRLAKR